MVRRFAVLMLVLLVAGCSLPARKSANESMPDMKALEAVMINTAGFMCAIGEGTVFGTVDSYTNKDGSPGWTTLTIAPDPETAVTLRPVMIVDFTAEGDFEMLYFDYDADGIVDKKLDTYEKATAEVNPTACEVAEYVLSKR